MHRRRTSLLATSVALVLLATATSPVAAQRGGENGSAADAQVPSTIVSPDAPIGGTSGAIEPFTGSPAATPASHSGVDPEFAEAAPFIGHHSFGQVFIGQPVLHESSGRMFLPTAEGVAVLDLDAELLAHEPVGIGGFIRDLVIDTNLFVLDEQGVVELDIDTLAEVNRYPKVTDLGFFRLAVLPDTLVVGAGNEGIVLIDRATGVETVFASIATQAGTTYMHHHASWGAQVVVPVEDDLVLFDVASAPPVEIARLGDRRGDLVTTAGDLLVHQGQGQHYELRSIPGFATISTTTVPESFRVRTVGAGADAGVMAVAENRGVVELYEFGGGPVVRVPNPSQGPHLLVPAAGDRVIIVDPIDNVVWAVSTIPSVTGVDQALFRPDWYSTMTIDGWGLDAATEVTVNGRSVPFTLDGVAPNSERTRLRLDVTGVPPAEEGEIVVVNPFGESSLHLDRDPPLGWAPLSIRSSVDGASDRDEAFRVECTNFRLDTTVPAGRTMTFLVPTQRGCFVEAFRTRSQMRSGFVDPLVDDGFADVWHGRIPFRSGAPAHVAFVRTSPRTETVFWLFNFPVGDAPDDVRYPFDITCGDWSRRVRLDPGFGARVAIPDSADDRCLAELVNDRGAETVISRQIDRFRVRKTRDDEMWFNRSSIDTRYMTFVIDHGGSDISNPVFVGVPYEDIGSRSSAGVVHVMPTGTDGRPRGRGSQMLRQGRGGIPGKAEAGDRFGEVLEVADFDGDGWLDVAVGVPREDLGTTTDAGLVHVIYGRADGYRGGRIQTFHQAVAGVPGDPGAGDRFGAALAALDWNGDGRLDLAIGVPGERVGGVPRAGIVQILLGGPRGLSATSVVELSQLGDDFDTPPEAGDRFGFALDGHESMLAIGVPREDLASTVDAGMVHLVDGLTGEQISDRQGAFTDDRPEQGDRYGEVVDLGQYTLVVGVPREDLRGKNNGGRVHVSEFERTYLDDGPLRWTSSRSYDRGDFDGARIGGGDRLGAAIVLIEVPGDPALLLIGSPGDGVAGRDGAGTVLFVELTPGSRRKFLTAWNHASAGVPGSAQVDGAFGASVTLGPWGSLLIGAPGVAVGGDVQAGELLSTRTLDDWASIDQDTGGVKTPAERRDRFAISTAS
ncbi:MAG: FG-GAP repeat protein [Actinomycetota bacterium]